MGDTIPGLVLLVISTVNVEVYGTISEASLNFSDDIDENNPGWEALRATICRDEPVFGETVIVKE